MPGLIEAASLCETLKTWLLDDAYDMWWTCGADHVHGGFHERLNQDGTPTGEARRSRLHPRQIYAYSLAEELGWAGPADEAIRHALDFHLAHYRRPDRLFRTLVDAVGKPLDDGILLYDQAFALIGHAAAFDALDDEDIREAARDIHAQLRAQLANPVSCFEESNPRILPLSANSHMHLLEANLAWMDLDHDARWQTTAAQIADLAMSRFIDPATGLLREFFDENWRPAPGEQGGIAEPGHLFEWAWLLLRWVERTGDRRPRDAALKLIELGERLGVDARRGVAFASINLDGSLRDPVARLWSQTERLKAACIAAEQTGEDRYWEIAVAAASAVMRYLDTPKPGLWRDRMLPDGTFVDEPAPASTFYHLVCAIDEFTHTVRRAS
ncbi:MAG TPA: AGE family epimerase/isomerase [Povalibacter sp.]|jgi:mannose-6-phosphate isomerase|nr:AGE family epimerase/isomerase [Povalibacter sp.]